MGNTVGSTSANLCNFFEDQKDAYILGLWCADSYWWSSSIGLSNTNKELIERFRSFLLGKGFPEDRIRYNRDHLFVNSRPLLREFIAGRKMLRKLKKEEVIWAYFGGRFNGDGCIDKDMRKDCRIVYTGEDVGKAEAEFDRRLLKKLGISETTIYYYRTSLTFVLYISRFVAGEFVEKTLPYSLKLQKLALVPRRDLSRSARQMVANKLP